MQRVGEDPPFSWTWAQRPLPVELQLPLTASHSLPSGFLCQLPMRAAVTVSATVWRGRRSPLLYVWAQAQGPLGQWYETLLLTCSAEQSLCLCVSARRRHSLATPSRELLGGSGKCMFWFPLSQGLSLWCTALFLPLKVALLEGSIIGNLAAPLGLTSTVPLLPAEWVLGNVSKSSQDMEAQGLRFPGQDEVPWWMCSDNDALPQTLESRGVGRWATQRELAVWCNTLKKSLPLPLSGFVRAEELSHRSHTSSPPQEWGIPNTLAYPFPCNTKSLRAPSNCFLAAHFLLFLCLNFFLWFLCTSILSLIFC